MDGFTQELDGFDEGLCQDRGIDVQLEAALRGGHGDDGLIAMNAAGDHGQGFALGRVHFARHDGRTRFVRRDGELTEAGSWPTCQEAKVVSDLHAVHRKSFESAMSENEVIASGQCIEFIFLRYERKACFFGDLSRYSGAEVFRRIETGTDSGAADGKPKKIFFRCFDHMLALFEHGRPSGDFLSEGERYGVLYMCAADLDDVHVFFALLVEGRDQFGERLVETAVQDRNGRNVHSGREGIVRRLRHVDVIIRVDACLAADSFELRIRDVRDDFIHVHIALRAGACLIHDEREFAVPLAGEDLVAGLCDDFRFFFRKLAFCEVRKGGAFLQHGKRMNDLFRHACSDLEVFRRALGLRAPHMIRRNFYFA